MIVTEHVPFSSLTTFRIGNTARFVIDIENKSEVSDAFRIAKNTGHPAHILGGGSNTLGTDNPFQAVILRSINARWRAYDQNDYVLVRVGAGMSWDAFVALAVSHEWFGIENLSLIPGTLGGAIAQNIGAYGAVLSDSITEVCAYDYTNDEFITLTKEQCAFGYRTSIFKKTRKYFIVDATFQFKKNQPFVLSYGDLAERFKNVPPTLQSLRTEIQTIRSKKFPPLDAFGTAGSFFLNPVVEKEQAAAVQEKYPDIPLFALPEGGVKIPVAWILDHVLHIQGMRIGGAFVWPQQTLVIAADTNATVQNVLDLSKKISILFFNEVKIKIFPEVMMLD